ncbi:MAG: methyltransferase domain-containing protein [Saprospiraceae bacterium]
MSFSVRPIKESWGDFDNIIPELISKYQLKEICEIGAGANPFLSNDFIQKKRLNYTLVDVDKEELKKGENNFKRKVLDFSSNRFVPKDQYDLIFSKMTLEHIQYPERLHKNIFSSLKKGGLAVHFFATLYSIPSCVNLLLPEFLSNKILFYIQQRDQDQHGKFPAYYRWTLGPVKKNVKRFESVGFQVVSYKGYVGHTYFPKQSFLGKVEAFYTKCLFKISSPYFSSNAIVVLIKK